MAATGIPNLREERQWNADISAVRRAIPLLAFLVWTEQLGSGANRIGQHYGNRE